LFSSYSNEMFLGNMSFNFGSLSIIISAYVYKYKSFPSIYLKILLVFLLYNVLHLILYQDIHPLFVSRYFFYISLAFFVIIFNFDKFFERLEKVIYFGALISLPLFLFQNLFFSQLFNAMTSLQNYLGITPPLQHEGLYYANTLFYTINSVGNRNCGFMFEPGAFGSILAIAIGLNIIHNNFNLKNIRLFVLLIALATTQSTTAFLALACVIVFYLVNKGLGRGVILIPFGVVVIFFLFQLPFMSKKISFAANNPERQLSTNIQLAQDSNREQSLGRFAGLLLNLGDFRKSPIVGIGGHSTIMEKSEHRWNVSSVNGLGDYLATFGLLGILFLIYNLSKTFKSITTDYGIKGHYYLVLIVLVISFSFMLIESPLFFAFQIYYISKVKIITGSDLRINNYQMSYSPSII
jgi:hypothetical protein